MAAFIAMQGLALGLQRVAASATPTLEGELQVDALLEDPTFVSSAEGLVTDFRIGGQPVLCSDKGAGWRMFHSQAQSEGHRSLGIPLKQKQLVSVTFALTGAATTCGAIGVKPIPPGEAVAPNDPSIAKRLDYVFGLGSVNIGAGATGELVATSRREGTLGLLVLYSPTAAAAYDVTVSDITVNNRPLLAGRVSGATIDRSPLAWFDYLNTDCDGRILACPIGVNETVRVAMLNNNAGAIDVYGGIFMLPE